MKRPRITVHVVWNQVVDFHYANDASGVVYCHDALERPLIGQWQLGKPEHWDDYVGTDGEGCFLRRQFDRWYLFDALECPVRAAGVNDRSDPPPTGVVPDGLATWVPFWGDDV